MGAGRGSGRCQRRTFCSHHPPLVGSLKALGRVGLQFQRARGFDVTGLRQGAKWRGAKLTPASLNRSVHHSGRIHGEARLDRRISHTFQSPMAGTYGLANRGLRLAGSPDATVGLHKRSRGHDSFCWSRTIFSLPSGLCTMASLPTRCPTRNRNPTAAARARGARRIHCRDATKARGQ